MCSEKLLRSAFLPHNFGLFVVLSGVVCSTVVVPVAWVPTCRREAIDLGSYMRSDSPTWRVIAGQRLDCIHSTSSSYLWVAEVMRTLSWMFVCFCSDLLAKEL